MMYIDIQCAAAPRENSSCALLVGGSFIGLFDHVSSEQFSTNTEYPNVLEFKKMSAQVDGWKDGWMKGCIDGWGK